MNRWWLLWSALAVLGASQPAFAYPTYQRLGYISCTACHTSPTGAGLLTPYGRSFERSAVLFFRDESEPKVSRFEQQLQARALSTSPATRASPFLMQSDYLAGYGFGESLRLDATLGLNLKRGASGTFAQLPSGWDAVVLRKAMASWNLGGTNAYQVGRDLLPGGLTVDDHTSFIRADNRRGVLDYPTQARYLYTGEKLQLMPYLFAPSGEETAGNAETGLGTRAEYALTPTQSIGATGLYALSSPIERWMLSGFTRLSASYWNGLIAEYAFTGRNQRSPGGVFFLQQVLYSKAYVSPWEWLEAGVVYERLKVGDPFTQQQTRLGPQIYARVAPWVTLIGDIRHVTFLGQPGAWYYAGQVFVHI